MASGSPVVLSGHTDPAAALDGADFVISSAEFGRFDYWRQDFEIPRRYGATQINGENGGPGAVFHSLRSIKNTLSICRNIEKYCPDAFLVNLSNPMSRVTLAINKGTKVRNVGMCHEMPIGVVRLARLLRIAPGRVDARASGINHFTFFTQLHDRRSGDDLLPRVRALFRRKVFDFGPSLTRLAAATERRLHRDPSGATRPRRRCRPHRRPRPRVARRRRGPRVTTRFGSMPSDVRRVGSPSGGTPSVLSVWPKTPGSLAAGRKDERQRARRREASPARLPFRSRANG